MFSYRHAFHAGNHADVLKHTVLIAVLRHMTQKDAPMAVFDTHAGAGLYRLDGDYAKTSGEAGQGFMRLANPDAGVAAAAPAKAKAPGAAVAELAPVLQDYLDLVRGFNAKGSLKVYPGSPFIIQQLLRERDKLKLFELHPTDAKTLSANVAQLEAGRQVAVLREDGFEALKKFPVVNASVDGNDIVYHNYFDIGVAVGSPRGLVVPILRDVDQMSFAQIEDTIRSFGQKAKDGSLSYEELTGGTFTISNGGVFGSMLSTPILNPPQSAILGMHNIVDRPVVENGEIVIRPMMYLALSYDHRIIDGREAVQCLVTIKQCMEDPARMLLGI